jgi:serine/threonine protein kinase
MDRTIAHYNLLERLGEGGLGEVYRARDTKFGRTVAVKIVPTAAISPEHRASFVEDARLAATLSHPNIAALFDFGEHDGGWYLAYEFALGVTLRQEIALGPLSPRRAVELAVQIADGLSEAHAHGVLHTDLRSETVILTQKGSAKILELGLSRWTRGGAIRARAATSPDSLGAPAISTVAYLSPEQALGSVVDARTDVFSLGVLLYEMLTGRSAFAAATPADTIIRVISAPLPAPSASVPDVSADLDAIVVRATAKEIDRRQQSTAALSAELRSVGAILDVRSGDSAHGDLLPIDDDPGSGRWWAAALVVLVAVGLAAWYWSAR